MAQVPDTVEINTEVKVCYQFVQRSLPNPLILPHKPMSKLNQDA